MGKILPENLESSHYFEYPSWCVISSGGRICHGWLVKGLPLPSFKFWRGRNGVIMPNKTGNSRNFQISGKKDNLWGLSKTFPETFCSIRFCTNFGPNGSRSCSHGARMYPYVSRMYPYVPVCSVRYSYVFRMLLVVIMWCFSHECPQSCFYTWNKWIWAYTIWFHG